MKSEPWVSADETPWEQTEHGVERQLLSYDPLLMMVRVRFAAGAVGAMHQHPHRQASYVAEGVFEVRIGEARRVLRAGDSFIVEPNVPHGVLAREAGMLIDAFTPARDDFLPGAG